MRAPEPSDATDLERLAEQIGDRLRHLSPARLTPIEPAVRGLLADLAAVGLQAEGVADIELPTVAARALGDQTSVLGRDLAAALRRRPDPVLFERSVDVLVRLRRTLP